MRHFKQIGSALLCAVLLVVQLPMAQAASRYEITAKADDGASIEDIEPERVERGEDSEVTFVLEDGYSFDRVEIRDQDADVDYEITNDSGETKLSDGSWCEVESDGSFVIIALYEIEADYRVRLYTEETDEDDDDETTGDYARVALSADSHIDIDTDCGSRVRLGETVQITMTPDPGYVVETVTLTVGGKRAEASLDERVLHINGRAYYISDRDDNSRVLIIRNIAANVRVEADSARVSMDTGTNSGTGTNNGGSNGSWISDQPYVPPVAPVTPPVTEPTQPVTPPATTQPAQPTTPPVTEPTQPVTQPQPSGPVQVLAVSSQGCTVASDSGAQVQAGGTVVFTVTPRAGYQLGRIMLKLGTNSGSASASASSLTVDGTAYTIGQQSGGAVTVTVPNVRQDVTLNASAWSPTSSPYLDRSRKVAFLQGNGDGTVTPEATMTRAEASVMLSRLVTGAPAHTASYTDVPASAWYAQAIGMLEGVETYETATGAAFRPSAAMTRGALAQWLANLEGGRTSIPCTYSDVSTTSPYYKAVAYGTAQGWLSGYADGTFRPDAPITRAEAAVMLLRVMCWEPDTAAIAQAGQQFNDMQPGYWGYDAVSAAAAGKYR